MSQNRPPEDKPEEPTEPEEIKIPTIPKLAKGGTFSGGQLPFIV